MSIPRAAASLAALGAVGAVTLGTLWWNHEERTAEDRSGLVTSSWSVESSTDFGSTWESSTAGGSGALELRATTAGVATQPVYRPFTLRTSVGTTTSASVRLRTPHLAAGAPGDLDGLRMRVVASADGTCAPPAFSGEGTPLTADAARTRQPIDSAMVDTALDLGPGSRTTAGPPLTLCAELSADPGSPAARTPVTVVWPLSVQRAD